MKVGDSVLFTSYAGDEFKIDGEEEWSSGWAKDDILAVID